MQHRDRYTSDRTRFLGRIEPGDGAWESMLGASAGDIGYDAGEARKYAHGHNDGETYVTAIHEDGECRFYGVTYIKS